MASANLSLNVTAILALGKKDAIPQGLNFTSTPGKFDQVNLPSGNTTVTPPAGTNTIVVVVPPTAATVTLKGVAGDTGIPLVLSSTDIRWFVLPIGGSFVVNCSVGINGIEVYYL